MKISKHYFIEKLYILEIIKHFFLLLLLLYYKNFHKNIFHKNIIFLEI